MRRALIVVTIVALSSAACGSSAKHSASSTTTTVLPTPAAGSAAPGSSTTGVTASLPGTVNSKGVQTVASGASSLTIVQRDFSFDPTFVHATAGATLAITLRNEGSVSHTFTIDGLGVDQEVQPGHTATLALRLPGGGTVAWYCRFHRAQGMQGAFVLPGADASGANGASTPGAGGP